MKTVTVNASHTYDVTVGSGLLASAGETAARLPGVSSAMIVSDDTVFGLYGNVVRKSLERSGLHTAEFVFPHGEASKNLTVYGALLEALTKDGLMRSDVIIALGGGVVGDLAGFAAATYLRGIRFVQVPTTLLAAVDSSVGGKTAVDLGAGKNLVGAFHQPSAVISDVGTLSTLPEEQYLSGAAETLKYGMIVSEPWFSRWASTPICEIYEETIGAAVTMKRDLVEKDEFDRGDRMLLNFGHTFGHAAEACSRYTLLHGQAVAMGMAVITRAAAALGHCSRETADVLTETLRSYGLPTEIPFEKEALLPHVFLDKKSRGGLVNLVVPERIGKCVILQVPKEEIGVWLKAGGVR